ncbi:hypothetical protein ACFL6S_20005 [Candidatus Poribacteria bacterium]
MSPLIVDDLMFWINDGGMVFCLDAKDGSMVCRDRIRGEYWASPIYAAGKIYSFSKAGKVSVISAAREFQLLAENEFDASFIASPAVAGNNIILRSLHISTALLRVTGWLRNQRSLTNRRHQSRNQACPN